MKKKAYYDDCGDVCLLFYDERVYENPSLISFAYSEKTLYRQ